MHPHTTRVTPLRSTSRRKSRRGIASPEAALTRALVEGAIDAAATLGRSLQAQGSHALQALSRRLGPLPPDVPAARSRHLVHRLRHSLHTHPLRTGLVLSLFGAGSIFALRRATNGDRQ